MGNSPSSSVPSQQNSVFSKFATAACDDDLSCNVETFTYALPFSLKPHATALFFLVTGEKDTVHGQELDRWLKKRQQSGFPLDLIESCLSIDDILSICINHKVSINLEEGASLHETFPSLSHHFTDAFFACITHDSPLPPIVSDLLEGWQLRLACMLSDTNLDSTPVRLFSSRSHGCSLTTLAGQVLGYESPLFLVLKNRGGAVFGAFLPRGFVEKKDFSKTDSGSFLFEIFPRVKVRRWSGRDLSRNFQYFNASNPHAVKGIGFGGQIGFFRLFVDEELKTASCLPSDATYDGGPLGAEVAELVGVEVWGVGGEEATQAYNRRRQDLREIREDRKKVDKKSFVESEFDKETFFGKTFQKAEQL